MKTSALGSLMPAGWLEAMREAASAEMEAMTPQELVAYELRQDLLILGSCVHEEVNGEIVRVPPDEWPAPGHSVEGYRVERWQQHHDTETYGRSHPETLKPESD